MKRLRKEVGKVRFFHAGEYGENLGRPHHHACLFGFDFEDKKLWKVKQGVRLWTSETLNRIWGHGYCVIGEVTFESAAYVARYIMKKITGEEAVDHYKGKEPEYTTMSRRPGIGKEFFDKFQSDIYNYDRVEIRNKLVRPPRYYDGLYEVEHPDRMEKIKLNRKEKINSKKSKTKTEKFQKYIQDQKNAKIKKQKNIKNRGLENE